MRAAITRLLAAVLVLGPTVLAFFSGGFFNKPRLVAGIAVWAIVAAAVLVRPVPIPRSRSARLALTGLVLLTAWTALSYDWAPLGDRAQGDIQRLLLYLGTMVAAAMLLSSERDRRWLEPVLALGVVIVTWYSLSQRLLPGLVTFAKSSSAQGRVEQPLTYWNAMGCLFAVGLTLCIHLAADRRFPRWTRAAAGLAGPSLGLGVYLSFSRGALFALGAGVAVLVVAAPSARAQARAAGTLIAGAGVVAFVASFFDTIKSLPPGQTGDTGDGAIVLAVLVAVSVITALAVRTGPVDTGSEPTRRVASMRGRWAALGVVVVFLAGLAGVAALDGSPAAKTAGEATSAARFGSADTVRYAFWGVALKEFRDHPVKGVGSGGFAVDWRKDPDRTESAVDAHSLYIETLGELGLVGAIFLAMFLSGVAVAAARVYRREPAVVGLVAAAAVWAVHAGLDWDWEMPALTGIVLLIAGALIAAADDPAPARVAAG